MASQDIKEKPPTINVLSRIQNDDETTFFPTFVYFTLLLWPRTCCILNDILWLPNNLFSLIIIPDSNHNMFWKIIVYDVMMLHIAWILSRKLHNILIILLQEEYGNSFNRYLSEDEFSWLRRNTFKQIC